MSNCLQTSPFSTLTAISSVAQERLCCALSSIGSIEKSDRLAIPVDRDWAKECLVSFHPNAHCTLLVQIFPGNTKGQGRSMYSLPKGWMNKNSVVVNGKTYRVVIDHHVKFMHFNKYVTSIEFGGKTKLIEEINTQKNQQELAGKWDRNNWTKLDKILETYISNWKKGCSFDTHFVNTGRQYLTLALGYSVNLSVPFEELQAMDKVPADYKVVGRFLKQCSEALVNLVEN